MADTEVDAAEGVSLGHTPIDADYAVCGGDDAATATGSARGTLVAHL